MRERTSIGRGSRLGVIALGICAAGAGAQQITGTISGTVTDPQGALISGAHVEATNAATGFTRKMDTDAAGLYTLTYLPAGEYSLSIDAPGFRRYLQQKLTLSMDQTLTVNGTLTLGESSQTVEVTDQPPMIQTQTVELARTITPEEIIGLPLVNRNAYAELSLTPGVMSNSASPQSNSSGTPNFVIGVPSTQVQVNGGIDGGVPTVSYYLDGGINMTGLRNYGNPLPNPDALQEFRVETNNFSAQYGRMSGAVVTALTKSGTNAFHGSLFEFNRNTALNARPWNIAKPQHYRRNMYGAALGGPLRHDRAFFFGSYGGLRQVVGTPLGGAVVPTAAQRLGDFTSIAAPLYLPGTKVPMVGANSAPGCATARQNCVPASLLDPTAANLLKLVPLPTTANGGYTGYFNGQTIQNEYLGKYDQVLGERDHVAASFFYLSTTQDAAGGGNIPWMTNQSFAKQSNTNISDIHTFTPNTANQAWLTFTRVAGGRVNLPPTGLDSLGSTYTTQGPKALPQLAVSGYFSAGGSLAGPVSDTDFYSVRDVVTTAKGRHQLDVGGELSPEKDMVQGNLYNFGVFSFNSSGPSTTGNALADFVVGRPASMEQDTPYHSTMSNWYIAAFAQDRYRMTKTLTLNLGLRWDVQTSPVESHNLTAAFVPGVRSTVIPSAPVGVLFPGDPGIGRGIAPNRYHHVSPRVGLAWDVFGDGNTAFRAAGGVFYGSVSTNEWNQPANALPFAVRQTFNCVTSLTNVYGCPASFPNGDPFPYTYNPSSPRFLSNAAVETLSPHFQWPYTYQFNASVQQQMPSRISLTIAYVGTLSRNLPIMVDANAPLWTPTANTTALSINSRRPYNNNGSLGQVIFAESNQTASYNGLQVWASRHLNRSLTVYGFYVFSKAMQSVNETASGLTTVQDYAALTEDRGPMDSDRRHTSALSAVWKPTFYHGDRVAGKALANGWTVSAIATFNSGSPFNVTTGADRNADSYTSDRPNLVAGVNPFPDAHRPRMQSRYAWFNRAAFVANGPGVPGGIGPGGADGNEPRNFLRAPGYRNIDLGIFRDIAFTHGIALQLRGEATNAFNMVSLSGPTSSLASPQVGWITSAATPRLLQLGARLTF